ncbi:hypothetical protein JCM9279_004289 [Rhodotorula babjevae]
MGRTSKPTEADEALSKQSLKAAVWYTIAQEEELSLPFAASEHFVASLAEVVFQQALTLGKDLERFANHAGRLTINADDVKLAARRNEPLYELLTTSAQQHGLTLAELKADASSSKAKGAKQVKAPRLNAPKKEVVREAETSTSAPKAEGKGKSAKAQASSKDKGKASRKGKEKARNVDDEDEEDLIEDDEPEASEAEVDLDVGAGGFVKASALKAPKRKPSRSAGAKDKSKGKGKAVLLDSDDDELDDEAGDSGGSDVGRSSGDESEEVGAKRRKGGKGETKGGSKKRRT